MSLANFLFFFSNAVSGDLLGLSTPPTSQPNAGNTGVLLDVLGDIYSGKPANSTTTPSSNMHNPKKYVKQRQFLINTYLKKYLKNNFRFVCKNNGVLFENDLIQIGVKSEFRQNLGRLIVFYGNKTSLPMQNFVPSLLWADDQAAKLSIQMKPVEPTLEAGAQIQQTINAECVDDYTGIFFFFNW